MRLHHTPSHWILVALVLAALLLTLSEAYGQSTGAGATFEGRPAMAGAQAGQGALAGPPQGGIGVQGSQSAQRSLPLRPPQSANDMPQGAPAADAPVAALGGDLTPGRDSSGKPKNAKEIAKPKDTGLARDQRSATSKSKRAVQRTIRRSRTGVGEIESRSGEGG